MIKENEELIEEYHLFLREKYTSSVFTLLQGVRELAKYYNKPLLELKKKELINWKDNIPNQNTRRGYVYSVNKFYKKHNREDLKLPLPHIKRAIRKPFTSKETKIFIKASEQDPLDNLVTLLLYDSICRPNVIKDIKISNIDFKTNKIWLVNRKANTELALLISPRLEQAIKNYLLVRPKPINKEDKDILIINKIYKKKYTTTHPFRRITRKIALRAGIKKDVTPYKVLKPSAITNRFEEKINPRIIQRLAGHKNIATTLIYDHTNDTDAIKYLQSQENEIDYTKLDNKEKAKIMLDKLFKGEIDKTTFDATLELIKINKQKENGDLIGYS